VTQGAGAATTLGIGMLAIETDSLPLSSMEAAGIALMDDAGFAATLGPTRSFGFTSGNLTGSQAGSR
jgi:hypothetical protein